MVLDRQAHTHTYCSVFLAGSSSRPWLTSAKERDVHFGPKPETGPRSRRPGQTDPTINLRPGELSAPTERPRMDGIGQNTAWNRPKKRNCSERPGPPTENPISRFPQATLFVSGNLSHVGTCSLKNTFQRRGRKLRGKSCRLCWRFSGRKAAFVSVRGVTAGVTWPGNCRRDVVSESPSSEACVRTLFHREGKIPRSATNGVILLEKYL